MDQQASDGTTPATTNGSVSEAQASGPIFIPPTDILEKGNTVIMLLDVPGADPASLDVTLDKRMLTISAKGNVLSAGRLCAGLRRVPGWDL